MTIIRENLFARCMSRDELIHQAIGAGSMAWQHIEDAGDFDVAWAKQVASDALARLEELESGWG